MYIHTYIHTVPIDMHYCATEYLRSVSCTCPLQVSALAGEVGERQRERDLVTHTLTDRTAQLQLLTTQNEVYVVLHPYFCIVQWSFGDFSEFL